MKNLHILPTDKPSRFALKSNEEFVLSNHLYSNSPNFTNYHIYITSDEKIKRGDWYIADNKVYKASVDHMPELYTYSCKKIILTTNQDLINDGVQEINDEFLEWFVKNPSCEEVEVIPLRKSSGWYDEKEIWHWDFLAYKIIIPKEESKQETLEEAAERLYPTTINSFTDSGFDMSETERLIFINGAKWQKEQDKKLYNEEEIINALHSVELRDDKDYSKIYNGMKKWFEQFKKK